MTFLVRQNMTIPVFQYNKAGLIPGSDSQKSRLWFLGQISVSKSRTYDIYYSRERLNKIYSEHFWPAPFSHYSLQLICFCKKRKNTYFSARTSNIYRRISSSEPAANHEVYTVQYSSLYFTALYLQYSFFLDFLSL